MEEVGGEVDGTVADGDAEFAEAGEEFFLDLSGHAGLLGAGVFGGVGVGVWGEGAALGGGFVESEAGADAVVEDLEALGGGGVAEGEGLVVALLGGEEELGDHVPVDAADAFVAEHRAGAAGEAGVLEYGFVKVENALCVLPDEGGVDGVFGEGVKGGTEVVGFSEGGCETVVAVDILDDDRGVVGGEEGGQQGVSGGVGVGEFAAFEEGRDGAFGVEQEGVLVGAEEGAGEECVEDVGGLGGGGDAGGEVSDLSFEHGGESSDGKGGVVGGELEEVVGVAEAFGGLAGADAGVEELQDGVEEVGDAAGGEGCGGTEAAGVKVGAVEVVRRGEGVEEAFAVGVGAVGEEVSVGVEGAVESGEEVGDVDGEVERGGGAWGGKEVVEEVEVAAEVALGDHGDADADEGVVGVVPFGALGVEPDARAVDEVGDFASAGTRSFSASVAWRTMPSGAVSSLASAPRRGM